MTTARHTHADEAAASVPPARTMSAGYDGSMCRSPIFRWLTRNVGQRTTRMPSGARLAYIARSSGSRRPMFPSSPRQATPMPPSESTSDGSVFLIARQSGKYHHQPSIEYRPMAKA